MGGRYFEKNMEIVFCGYFGAFSSVSTASPYEEGCFVKAANTGSVSDGEITLQGKAKTTK